MDSRNYSINIYHYRWRLRNTYTIYLSFDNKNEEIIYLQWYNNDIIKLILK